MDLDMGWNVILVGDGLEVGMDFRLRGEHPRPIGVQGERKGVEVGSDLCTLSTRY